MLETVTIEFKDREIDVVYTYIPADPPYRFREGGGYPGMEAQIHIESLTRNENNNYARVIERYIRRFDKGKFCRLHVWKEINLLIMEQHEKYAY